MPCDLMHSIGCIHQFLRPNGGSSFQLHPHLPAPNKSFHRCCITRSLSVHVPFAQRWFTHYFVGAFLRSSPRSFPNLGLFHVGSMKLLLTLTRSMGWVTAPATTAPNAPEANPISLPSDPAMFPAAATRRQWLGTCASLCWDLPWHQHNHPSVAPNSISRFERRKQAWMCYSSLSSVRTEGERRAEREGEEDVDSQGRGWEGSVSDQRGMERTGNTDQRRIKTAWENTTG